jgi:hypothetical protein
VIEVLDPDPEAPGVFLFARKPDYPFERPYAPPCDLSTMQLHSMQTGARTL